MRSTHDHDVIRTLEAWHESEQQYERFLALWGIDRTTIGRAALGEHLAGPGQRAQLASAIAAVEAEPLSVPEGRRQQGQPEQRVPPHAIRI